MPNQAKRLCNRCRRVPTHDRYCSACSAVVAANDLRTKQQDDIQRDVYKTNKWRKFRAYILAKWPFCKATLDDDKPCGAWANTVDHIKPIKLGGAIWDEANCQPLCQSCHSRKTLSETKQRYPQG